MSVLSTHAPWASPLPLILTSVQTNPMRTHYISDGVAFRNRRMSKPVLSNADKRYLVKATNFVDHIWVYFSGIETDFRLLHMPMQ